MSETAFLYDMEVRVRYGDRDHLTTGHGALDLLDGRLGMVGVTRDAKAAALRAFTEAARRSHYEGTRLDFQAGVITITNKEDYGK